jgi:D-amino peptidase
VRVIICTDVEGVSGIDRYEMVTPRLCEEARTFATEEVNAAMRGIWKQFPEAQIDIFDGHGMGGNLIAAELSHGSNLLGGGWMETLLEMVRSQEISKYDAAMLLGQHAAAGTLDGFMSHTNTAGAALRINKMDVGEAPQLAWLLGYFNVPVPLITGDDAVVREAKCLLSRIETVAVKTAESRARARCIPIEEAHLLIEDASHKVMRDLGSFKPHSLQTPVEVEIIFSSPEMAKLAARFPRTVMLGQSSVSYKASDYLEGWFAYNTCRIVVTVHQQQMLMDYVADIPEVRRRRQELVETQTKKWISTTEGFPIVRY